MILSNKSNKGADQTVQMHSLICAFVVHKPRRQVFSRQGPYLFEQNLIPTGSDFYFLFLCCFLCLDITIYSHAQNLSNDLILHDNDCIWNYAIPCSLMIIFFFVS